MAQKSLPQQLLGLLVDFLEDARDVLSDDHARQQIINDLGGTAPGKSSAAPQFPPSGLDSAKAYRDSAQPSLEAMYSAIQDVRATYNALRAFSDSLDLGGFEIADETFRSLVDLLALNFIRLRAPRLFFIMQATSFAEDFSSTYGGEFGSLTGLGRALCRTLDFAVSPCSWFDQTNFDDDEGVQKISDRALLGVATALVRGVKVPFLGEPADDVLYGWDLVPGAPGSAAPSAGEVALARALTLKFIGDTKPPKPGDPPQGQVNTALLSLAFLPRTQGGPGMFLSLGGGYEVDAEIAAPWHLSVQLQTAGAVSALISRERKFEIIAPTETSDFRATVALEARPDPVTGKSLDFTFATDTGLSVGLLRFEGSLSKESALIKTTVRNGVLSVGKIFDNFLDRLLPGDGLRVGLDFAVGLDSRRGLFLEGQAPSVGGITQAPKPAATTTPAATTPTPTALAKTTGTPLPPLPPLPKPPSTGQVLSIPIPIGKTLGPLTIHDVQVGLGTDGTGDNRAYLIEAASSVSTKLGPVMARVDRIGVRLALRVPEEGDSANLGVIDLDVGPKFPEGIALAIDAKGVLTGGGFLFRDRAQGLYAGVMQLTLQERMTLKAFGLVATKMPDGSKGYSLIVFITAEDFKAIPLGLGFTLQGIGGMVAINRTFDEEAMLEGLKTGTLGNLLFPKDPIRNAPEIIRSLATVFPARSGSYLFGVLAKIGWFTPTLIFFDLALIFEFGARKRLIVLGRITSTLPSKDNDLVRLNLDSMGIIDFDEKSVRIDAVLVDSRLAHKFVLTGGMALRARLAGPNAGFVLAVGGFNPRFLPPAGVPKLDRITIALSSGNNPRLTCAAYFAITTNTLQFGARAQLYAGAYGFSIEGDIGFDVLIHFAPFHFIADFHASIQLKRGSRNLFKVKLEGSLEGPRPLRVSGKASFEIFWCDFSVRFDKTLIEGEKPPLPPAVDVLSELRRALGSPQAWSTDGAASRQHGVTLRTLKPGPVLVLDPLGNMMVKQSVVPLNTSRDIDTFGGAPVAGARRFQIKATLNGQTLQTSLVKDQFVPSQFFAMSDDEKLASPSFEDMDAGIVFGSNAVSFDETQSVAAPLEYESIVVDAAGPPVRPPTPKYVLTAARLFEQARFGAVAQAPIRQVGAARFRDLDAPRLATLNETRYVMASVDDAKTPPPAAPVTATWSESRAAMSALNRAAGVGTALWQLVPVHETKP